MDDTTVVSLTDYRKNKENQPRELWDVFYCTDEVLDILEDNFDEAVCIGMQDGYIQVTGTVEDIDTIVFMLEEALYNVRNNY